MRPYRRHVFVCTGARCAERGSEIVLEELKKQLQEHDLRAEVRVTPCGSVGLCQQGPNLIIYPEGVWYSRVSPADVAEIVQEHLVKGQVVARLLHYKLEAF